MSALRESEVETNTSFVVAKKDNRKRKYISYRSFSMKRSMKGGWGWGWLIFGPDDDVILGSQIWPTLIQDSVSGLDHSVFGGGG